MAFDTTPEMANKMHLMMQAKTPLEKLKMGSSMFDTSKYLVTCGILAKNPNISEVELKPKRNFKTP